VTWPESLRRLVESRASGRCEYCLLAQADAGLPHEVDHVISRKHGGLTNADNLAFPCYLCNRYKGSDIASFDFSTNKLVRLFHPRQDRWGEHFRVAGPLIEPLTDIGSATTRLLRLNITARVMERQLLQSLDRYPAS
jgi:hypothetical protein